MSQQKLRKDDVEIVTRSAQQLGAALARFRDLSALSQASTAAGAGLRQATVSKMEQGHDTTQIGTLYEICAALDLEVVIRPRRKSKGPMTLEDFT